MREKIAEVIIKGRIDDKNAGEIADLILALPVGTRTTRDFVVSLILSEALETLKEIVAAYDGSRSRNEYIQKIDDLLDGLEVT